MQDDVAVFAGPILRTVDRIVAALDGLTEEQAAWRPAVAANSIAMIATHMLGNLEEVVLGVLCGGRPARDRDAEFERPQTVHELRERWPRLRQEIEDALGALPPDALGLPYQHPRRGTLSGTALLLTVARHASEHQGHAELTRDLVLVPSFGLAIDK